MSGAYHNDPELITTTRGRSRSKRTATHVTTIAELTNDDRSRRRINKQHTPEMRGYDFDGEERHTASSGSSARKQRVDDTRRPLSLALWVRAY